MKYNFKILAIVALLILNILSFLLIKQNQAILESNNKILIKKEIEAMELNSLRSKYRDKSSKKKILKKLNRISKYKIEKKGRETKYNFEKLSRKNLNRLSNKIFNSNLILNEFLIAKDSKDYSRIEIKVKN